MSAPSFKTVELRDRLNAIIESIQGEDQEAYIMRCCVAVGVEELEKWMYEGNYTPSVKPCTEKIVFLQGTSLKSELDIDSDLLPFTQWSQEEKDAFRGGQEIRFIKAYRTRTGSSLKDSKFYIERQRDIYPNLWGSFAKKTP